MDATRSQQLIRQRAVAKACLSLMKTFIESDDHKVNEIQLRFDDLPDIFNRCDTAQNELELLDVTDHSADRELFETQYYEVKTKFDELLHPAIEQPLSRRSSPRSSLLEHNNQSPRSHVSSTHIKLPVIALPTIDGYTCSWLQFRHL
jgi:hypothetical protein